MDKLYLAAVAFLWAFILTACLVGSAIAGECEPEPDEYIYIEVVTV